MTQHNIKPIDGSDTGVELRLNLDSFEDAQNTLHRGATRPAYAQAGMAWVKEVSGTLWELNIFDGTTDVVIAAINPSTGAFSLPNDSVGNAAMQANAVNTGNVLNEAITNEKVANQTLASGKLADLVLRSLGGLSVATGDVIYGSAANTLARLAAGTNGHVLTLAAGLPVWAAAATGGGVTQQTFYSSGTWNRPVGCTSILVFVAGGGGGGGGAAAFDSSAIILAGGGGAAETGIGLIDVTGIASQVVTIGAGGAGGPATGGADRSGSAGGSSSFGAGITCGGGTGGAGISISSNRRGLLGGSGGSGGAGGNIRIAGQNGRQANSIGADLDGYISGGDGGGSFFGSGGGGGRIDEALDASASGQAGTGPGAGGGGAISQNTNSATGAAGGDGFPGIAFILEFYG